MTEQEEIQLSKLSQKEDKNKEPTHEIGQAFHL